jgi:hypothetical protein
MDDCFCAARLSFRRRGCSPTKSIKATPGTGRRLVSDKRQTATTSQVNNNSVLFGGTQNNNIINRKAPLGLLYYCASLACVSF